MKISRYYRSGSSLVVVMVVTTVLLICFTSLWQALSLATDTALKRQNHEQLFRATDALMIYACNLCKNNFHILKEQAHIQKNSINLKSFSTWPLDKSQKAQGKIEVSAQGEALKIQVYLAQNERSSSSLSCILEQEEGDDSGYCRYSISSWSHE